MKIMHCPLNGPRNISEFTYGGQVHTMPDPKTCDDPSWARYVFYEENAIGIVREWWQHTRLVVVPPLVWRREKGYSLRVWGPTPC